VSDNPLVAQPDDPPPQWYSGIPVAEDIARLVESIQSGDWLDTGLDAAVTGLDGLSAEYDPLGTLLQSAVGWLIEHIKPLTDLLDELAGDAGAVAAQAQTWRNIGQTLNQTADTLATDIGPDTAGWTGAAADAYRVQLNAITQLIRAQGNAAEGLGTATELAGTVVATVRTTLRDFIADCVGRLVDWVLEELVTEGAATPLVVEQAEQRIASWVVRAVEIVTTAVRVLSKLAPILQDLGRLLDLLRQTLDKIANPGGPPNEPPGTHGTGQPGPQDPFDRLPPEQQNQLVQEVINESAGKMTRESAARALQGGPPGSTLYLPPKGTAGPDIRFFHDQQPVLDREVKALNGTYNSFNNNMKKATGQIENNGEVFMQVPEGTSPDELNSWVARWRGTPNRNMADYVGVNLIFCDTSGKIVGSGNLAHGRIG
jgi:uncharacterized protein YukE